LPPMGLALNLDRWQVACHTNLVPIGVSEVRAVVVLVVLGPQTRLPLRCAAICESNTEYFVHRCTALCEKGNHIAVTRLRRELVIRLSNEEEGSRSRGGLPASPRAAPLTKARLDAKALH
jgi:hypothetical protein